MNGEAESDEALIERFQRAAFDYFLTECNPANGLVADTSRAGAPASIAVVGFALSCYASGVERGWMSRSDAAAREALWGGPGFDDPSDLYQHIQQIAAVRA